ncbi:endonuclease/exonuclease/phosphatase family protein [Aquimarina sp. Aq78]|uniref:endonuclease/exonuclease/phosphatase family protein n=2 Tax=Aquimarina sp. Aq78 TaxID=1191889 RepID=UPI000D0F4871|nr:endonuclease/exonuclease/phosphatase family protein [Aquimarina sp. Aq78]
MMKNLKLIVLLTLVTLSLNAQKSVMSYNIRYNNPNDNENWWENRKQEVVQMIQYYSPDILGIQEGLNDQVKYVDTMLTNYSFVGVGRGDGHQAGEYAALFFNINTIELIETKTFWLSEKTDTVSIGWDASMERIVTYGQFRDKSTRDTIHVFNCHYDHLGEIARENSSKLVLRLIKKMKIENERIAVIGDLNCLPNTRPIQILKTKLEDSFESSKTSPYGPIGTFNGFNSEKKIISRIDYILIKNIVVNSYSNIDDRRRNNLLLSDHLPVFIRIE